MHGAEETLYRSMPFSTDSHSDSTATTGDFQAFSARPWISFSRSSRPTEKMLDSRDPGGAGFKANKADTETTVSSRRMSALYASQVRSLRWSSWLSQAWLHVLATKTKYKREKLDHRPEIEGRERRSGEGHALTLASNCRPPPLSHRSCLIVARREGRPLKDANRR